jgi:two-component system sensor histidine kinase YesM
MLDQVQDLIDKEYKANLREREAQLNSLTAIINPHFIYNTLEVIKMKAYLNNDNQVVDMLTALAKLFRIMTHTSARYTT